MRAQIGHDHGIVCRNEAISDTRMALGMARDAMEADFRFVPQKLLFPFLECQNRVAYAYQLSFHCSRLQRCILNFVQAPADFVGTRVVLYFIAKKSTS
jgi:hypothetical protein